MRSRRVTPATRTSTSNRNEIRMAFHKIAAPARGKKKQRGLRLQTGRGPGAGVKKTIRPGRQVTRPTRPVVNASLALNPQLDRVYPEAVAAPVRGSWNDKIAVAF